MSRIFFIAFLSILICKTTAQPIVPDSTRDLRKIAQGAEFPVGVLVKNPDSIAYKLKLNHICGCTEFEKTNYDLPANSDIFIPVKYHSSGNKGKLERGYFIEYFSATKSGKIKIKFTADVDTVRPWTTPVADSAMCYRFNRTYINSGTIKEGSVYEFKFLLFNCSTKPLIIQSVQSSCGCLAPYYPSTPVGPGKTVEIIGKYYTIGRPGIFQKTMTVHLQNGDSVSLMVAGIVE